MSRYLNSSLIYRSFRCYSSASSGANKFATRLIPKRLLKASEQTPNFESEEKIEQISEAVQRYLQQYEQHTEFFANKNKEFEQGKRHLANIMGYDPENITQEQIDKAIQYLFPSGLFHYYGLPIMRPPSEIYPKFKAAYYDRSGRPFSSFFYTSKPNLYQSLFELYKNYDDLNRFEDKNIRKGIQPKPEDKFNQLIHMIFDKNQLENLFVEKLSDEEYEKFVKNLTKFIEHPYSALKTDFIKRFTLVKKQQKINEEIYKILVDEEGRTYSEASGYRKSIECRVKVYNNGTGKFLINDKYTINHFSYFLPREQILSPLVMANLVDKLDIYAYFKPIDQPLSIKNHQAQAGAIRYCLSKAICPFVDDETKELLRMNGLLQHDIRIRERKKPGLYRARAKPPFRKR